MTDATPQDQQRAREIVYAKYSHINRATFECHLADMTLPAWDEIRAEVAGVLHALAAVRAESAARIAELEQEIAEAREACPVVRRQDYFDASLLTLVNEEISQLFRMQSRAEAAEARIGLLDRVLGEFSQEVHLMSVRMANSTMTPEKLRALLDGASHVK